MPTSSNEGPPVATPLRPRRTSAGWRVTWSTIAGLVVGVAVSFALPAAASVLVGWDCAAMVFLVWIWVSVLRLDAHGTRAMARRDDPSRRTADILVVSAGTAVLVAVAFVLVKAGNSHGAEKAGLIALGALSVVVAWAVVHTTFMLQYACAFYAGGGGVDFNDGEDPVYLDFAYLAFTIGMTFQVSDTNITAKPLRRIALRHALISFLFGAVIIGLVINIVASLL